MLLNFHTHSEPDSTNKAIRNIILGVDDIKQIQQKDKWFSVGIHPWYINENKTDVLLEQMEQLALSDNIKLIGECGLDRLKGAPLGLQQKVFEAQIRIAEKVKKPLIIHCVRCFSELLEIKKRLSPKVPMVIHGFNNKLEVGNQLLNAGFFFSIGSAILKPGSNAAKFLISLPDNRLFLETDDNEYSIEEVYEAATAIRNSTLNQLKDTIFANWMSLQSGSF